MDLYFILFGTKKPACLMDETQQHLTEEMSSRRKSPLIVREDIEVFKEVCTIRLMN